MDMDMIVLVYETSGNFYLRPLLYTLEVQLIHLNYSTLLYQYSTKEN